MENNTVLIYTRRVAYELRMRGFNIVKVVPDRVKPQFDNFVFEDSPELRAALEEIAGKKATKNG